MRLAVLGSIQAISDSGAVLITSARQRQILAVLVLHRDRVVPADTIAELVWGEDRPADPAATIQTNVSRLRRVLPPPLAIETVGSGYLLICPPDEIDVVRFETGLDGTAGMDDEAFVRAAEEVLKLWRGTPYAEIDHPDVESERQRLQEKRDQLVESVAGALVELGRNREAILLIEPHIRANPYREMPVATLMRALYGEGRQAEALAAYGRLRTRLVEDLGVDPSEHLRELEVEILNQTLATSVRPLARRMEQRIRFCNASDGTRLAYALSGSGPPLVKAANWMSHLDYDWESPVWRHWNEGLSARHTLVRYDERGCGLSDWDVDRFEFDAWVDDLATVVDAIGLDRFPLLGISQGGAVAIAYAVRHPERVSKLVLYGSYPRGRLARAVSEEQRREAALHLDLARIGWGQDNPAFRNVFTYQFMPEGTIEEWAAFDELQKRTCSPENAVRFLETFATIDVTDLARQVTCPALILHSRNEVRVPFENAVEMASLIPGSSLVPLESTSHILTGRDRAWPRFLEVVEDFLG